MQFDVSQVETAFGSAAFEYVLTSQHGHVFRLTLARPGKRNAFNRAMSREIALSLLYANLQAEVRCIVIDAQGPVFCAGADLQDFGEEESPAEAGSHGLPGGYTLGDVFRALRKPCLAQVEGPVLAGGFLIVCGCHLVFSVPDATFVLPEVTRGLWPMQVMASLRAVLPPRKALEMCLTGRPYTAAEALAAGLVTHIAGRDSIADEVGRLAELLSSHAPLAVGSGLDAWHRLDDLPPGEQHAYLKGRLDQLLASEDAKEGARAFFEGRKPAWKGR